MLLDECQRGYVPVLSHRRRLVPISAMGPDLCRDDKTPSEEKRL
jgi:hypothetical protein